MRQDAHAGMTKCGAKEELQIYGKDRKQRQSPRTRSAFTREAHGASLDPVAAAIKRQQHGNCKERLAKRGMSRGDVPGQEVKDGKSAKYALCNHGADGRQAEIAHPPSFLNPKSGDTEEDRQQANELRDHAMSVLKLHAAHHGRNLV